MSLNTARPQTLFGWNCALSDHRGQDWIQFPYEEFSADDMSATSPQLAAQPSRSTTSPSVATGRQSHRQFCHRILTETPSMKMVSSSWCLMSTLLLLAVLLVPTFGATVPQTQTLTLSDGAKFSYVLPTTLIQMSGDNDSFSIVNGKYTATGRSFGAVGSFHFTSSQNVLASQSGTALPPSLL